VAKAAAARIPAQPPADGAAPKLIAVDPKTGWLTDMTLKPMSDIAPAPVTQYKGDPNRASWHFDEELAKAAMRFHAGLAKKDQYILWKDPVNIDAGARYYFTKPVWAADGQTLEVSPVYCDKVPDVLKEGKPRWPDAGSPTGHSKAPLMVKVVAGPLAVVGPTSLRVWHDNLSPAGQGGRCTFMAYSLGDDEYRYAEQVGMLPKNFGPNTTGEENTITFAPIGNLKVGQAPVPLKATATSGKKVEFYVAHGPAEVVDGQLTIMDLPTRAKYPVMVKVVAWQWGSITAPKVKTATPVEQEIVIQKP
jgi:hypothetical protein